MANPADNRVHNRVLTQTYLRALPKQDQKINISDIAGAGIFVFGIVFGALSVTSAIHFTAIPLSIGTFVIPGWAVTATVSVTLFSFAMALVGIGMTLVTKDPARERELSEQDFITTLLNFGYDTAKRSHGIPEHRKNAIKETLIKRYELWGPQGSSVIDNLRHNEPLNLLIEDGIFDEQFLQGKAQEEYNNMDIIDFVKEYVFILTDKRLVTDELRDTASKAFESKFSSENIFKFSKEEVKVLIELNFLNKPQVELESTLAKMRFFGTNPDFGKMLEVCQWKLFEHISPNDEVIKSAFLKYLEGLDSITKFFQEHYEEAKKYGLLEGDSELFSKLNGLYENYSREIQMQSIYSFVKKRLNKDIQKESFVSIDNKWRAFIKEKKEMEL